MQNLSKYAFAVLLLLCITQCKNDGKEVEGKWQIKAWGANGTMLGTNVFGNSVWQFEDDKYTVQIANIKDEGRYHVNKDSLFMKSETTPERPEIFYLIKHVDTARLILTGDIKGNKSEISFIRVNLP